MDASNDIPNYWGSLFSQSFSDTWDAVVEHSVESLIVIFIIAITVHLLKYGLKGSEMKKAVTEAFQVLAITFVVFLCFFLIHVLFVTPHRLYENMARKYRDRINQNTIQEKIDYINQNRPFLEPELVEVSVVSNAVNYYFDIQNNGNLPATGLSIEQTSPDFTDLNHESNRNIFPKGEMRTENSTVFLPSHSATSQLSLYLDYKGEYEGTNVDYNSQFLFYVDDKVGRYKYVDLQPNAAPYKGQNEGNALSSFLNMNSGSFYCWCGENLFLSSTQRMLVYDLNSKTAIFESVTNGTNHIFLSLDIPPGKFHLLAISWATNGALLGIDSNSISKPADWPDLGHPNTIVTQPKIYDRTLTTNEMEQIMKQGPPKNSYAP
ncbi:MAG TPA: hypothetical protein VMH87_01280 [Pseudomonadales bacterium]|nr:hypothetical protein [Pseudomonadales bacterium]